MKQNAKKPKPNKHLGQNFLVSDSIKNRIIECCQLSEEDCVLEIGPGEGALTRLIAPRVKSLIAVDADKSLAKKLTEDFTDAPVEIVHQDFLKFNMKKLPQGIKIIGNLPYNISTPILTKILNHTALFSKAYFTVQLEFGQRLAAKINTKDYGAFSCFTQYHSNVQLLFKINHSAFWPAPKVQSCFLEITPKKDKPLNPKQETFLFKLIHEAFKQRRKQVINSLGMFQSKDEWMRLFEKEGISPQARAENIRIDQYIQLAKAIKSA